MLRDGLLDAFLVLVLLFCVRGEYLLHRGLTVDEDEFAVAVPAE